MIEVPLTQGKIALIDDIDGDLLDFKWRVKIFNRNSYAIRDAGKKVIFMHRIILQRILERELDIREFTDHVDCDGLNNTRSNLRIADRNQNTWNTRKRITNISGFKGVSWNNKRKKWTAQISVFSKDKHIGYFDDPEEAYEAYCNAAIEYFGEFARLE